MKLFDSFKQIKGSLQIVNQILNGQSFSFKNGLQKFTIQINQGGKHIINLEQKIMTDPQADNYQLSLNCNNISDFEDASSRIIDNDEINTISVNNFSYKNLSQGQQNETPILFTHFSELRNNMNFNFIPNNNNQPQQQSSIDHLSVREISQYPQIHIQSQQQQPAQILATCLESLTWSLRKIYYRNFFNRLITFYIQSLKEEQKLIRQTKEIEIKQLKEQNWPFKELFYKKYRNPNQQIMLEFINLCASKIQATFKAYIMSKRHKQAISKINIFKRKLKAVMKGWKSSNIYNCKKLKQIRNNFMQISLQIDQEIVNPNIDRMKKMKKIEYLQLSQQTLRENFMKSFGYLYETGTWIFQVDKCFKQPKSGFKIKEKNFGINSNQLKAQTNNFGPEVQNNPAVQTLRDQQKNESQQPQKKTRKRQFRGGKNQTKMTLKQLKPQITPSQQNSESLSNNKQSLSTTATYQSGEQQRPIMTKGKYEFTEQDINQTQNEFLKVKGFKPKEQQNVTEKNITNEENSEQPRVNKFKDEEKKRLVKRQKYDPRKAIQEEKKRIEQEKKIKMQKQKQKQQSNPQKKLQQNQEINPLLKKVIKKQPQASNKRTPRKQKPQQQQKQQSQPLTVQSPRQSNKQKTLQKIKKESKLTKKGDNSKSIKSININPKKVESKVDCWGPKKESAYEKAEKVFVSEESSYKSKYLTGLKEKNESKHSINDNPMALGSMNQKRQKINPYKIKQQQWTPIQQNPNQYQEEQQEPSQSIKQKFSYGYYRKENQQQRGPDNQQEEGQQEEETYQSSYLRKLVEEREKEKFSYGNGRSVSGKKKSSEKPIIRRQQERLQQRFQHISNHIKQRIPSSYEGHQNPSITTQQKPSQPSQKKPVNQSHRSIESLEQVYCSQYTDRLNNLKNKLNMLQSARYIQRDESVPVLLEDSRYMNKIYKDGVFSTLYWPQVRTMETAFLDYVKLTGF